MSHETRDKSQEYAAARGQNPRVDSNGIAIKVTNVSKGFKLPHDKQNSIKGGLISLVKNGKRTYEKQEVLKDISFEIKKGEFFGIVGRNGSGKSTLLKMLAGIYTPTAGSIQVNGSLTPFIELGVGFNMELTGRENVYLNGALLGFNRTQMDEMYAEIVDFAELERFMDQKLKNYSSGMQVRLAFSIAIRAQSDILLLDEVLAVGDESFQQKCYDYFDTLKRKKKTVILVTHDMSAVERFCTKAMLVHNGEIVSVGAPHTIAEEYSVKNKQAYKVEDIDKLQPEQTEIKIKLQSVEGTAKNKFDIGERLRVSLSWPYDNVHHIGVAIARLDGVSIYGTNTKIDHVRISDNKTIEYEVALNINEGRYYIQVGLFNSDGIERIDYLESGPKFAVSGSKQERWVGLARLDHDWRI